VEANHPSVELKLLIYPDDPKPLIDDAKSPSTIDISSTPLINSFEVLMLLNEPWRELIDEILIRELMYDEDPKPWIVEVRLKLLIYPADPRPPIVENRSFLKTTGFIYQTPLYAVRSIEAPFVEITINADPSSNWSGGVGDIVKLCISKVFMASLSVIVRPFTEVLIRGSVTVPALLLVSINM